MNKHDLVIVGSGSGLQVARAGAQKGLDVAVVEESAIGGTCLNRGCIPSKMLIHRANVAETIEDSEKFGISSTLEDIDFHGITKEVNESVDSDSEAVRQGIKRSGIYTLYEDRASFVDERTLKVGDEKVRGEKMVVAAGARPRIPTIEGLDEVDYITSKEALKLEERPEHLVIVGGGYIAAELGHFFGSMGSDITVLEANETLIGGEDREVSKKFTSEFSKRYEVKTNTKVKNVSQKRDRKKVTGEKNGETVEVSGDELLIATGRRPNSDILDVEKGNVETDEKGFIKVNDKLETTAENTWALGDIVGGKMLKHVANLEAEYVTMNAVIEHEHSVNYTAIPHAIFSSPEVSGIGKTEEELEKEGKEYLKGTFNYEDTGFGSALKSKGFAKALVSPKSGEILGCHIIGPRASMLIHEVSVSMRKGSGKADDIIKSIHVHPALNEVVQRAFESLEY
ncbi:MAG: dihydrolipoyl dehydrogenase [Candidatus Aenigmatarchaeota archaeon]